MHNFELHEFASQGLTVTIKGQNIFKITSYYFQVALIHIGLEMVFAMIRLTLGIVIMMVETVVATISTMGFALIVNVISMRLVQPVLILQLVMAIVMMRLTMKTAIMIVESAVALAHRGANVPNVPVLVEMMVLVTVSPTYYSYFSNGVHTVFFYITKWD